MDQNAERVNPSSDPAEVGGLAESCHLLAECFSTPSLVFFQMFREGDECISLQQIMLKQRRLLAVKLQRCEKKRTKKRDSCYHTVVLSMMVGMI